LSADGVLHLLDRGVENQRWEKSLGELTVLSRHDGAASAGSTPQGSLLVRARISGRSADELVVVDSVNQRLHIVMSDMLTRQAAAPVFTDLQLPHDPVVVDIGGELIAVLPMRLNADARTGLMVHRKNSLGPVFVPPPPGSVYIVNSTGD